MSSIKLILVGEAQVGKTAIINQYIQNTFEEEYIATIGQEKQTKEISLKNGTKFKLEIWDTIGQDTYSAANKIFMRNAKIALLVYDITKEESFKNLNKFYTQVCDINGKDKIIFGVVGNKSDLYEERTVEEEDGQKYATDIGASFFETSAKDHDTIENLFEGICEKLNNKDNKNNNDGKDNSNNNNDGKENSNKNNDGNNVNSQSNEGFKISSSPNQPKTSEKKGWC